MMKNIEAKITEYSKRSSCDMTNVKKGRRKNINNNKIVIDDYIFPVIPFSEDDEENDSDEDSDSEN